MKLNKILDFVNFVIAKEQSGDILSPAKFNTLLPAVNLNMYNSKVKEAELFALQNGMLLGKALLGSNLLREFHANQTITFSGGHYNLTGLSSTFGYFGTLTAIVNNRRVEIEPVTVSEFTERRTNLIHTYNAIEDYPIVVLYGSLMDVYPTNITSSDFWYIKLPTDPVYDYYLDQYQNKVYLEVSESHLLTTGETGSAGQIAGQTVNSLTVELEWNAISHLDFCYELIKKCSPNLDKPQLYQYAQQEKVL